MERERMASRRGRLHMVDGYTEPMGIWIYFQTVPCCDLFQSLKMNEFFENELNQNILV